MVHTCLLYTSLRGADVTLVTGKTYIKKPDFVKIVEAYSAKEMFNAVNGEFEMCIRDRTDGYTSYLKEDGLKGKKIGYLQNSFGYYYNNKGEACLLYTSRCV